MPRVPMPEQPAPPRSVWLGVDPSGCVRHLSGLWHSVMGGRRVGRSLEIIYDYVDPGSYLTLAVLQRWLDSGAHAGVSIRWRPLELCPPGRPLLNPRDPEWSAMQDALSVDASMLGRSFRTPAQIPWSRKAHELALHAQASGDFLRIHAALFRAHFEEGDDLSRVDRLVHLASEEGMEASEVRTVLGVDRFVEAVEAEREALLALGVRGVPTLRLDPDTDDERWLEGYQGVEVLESTLELLENRDRQG